MKANAEWVHLFYLLFGELLLGLGFNLILSSNASKRKKEKIIERSREKKKEKGSS
jgi:hypothetical protein